MADYRLALPAAVVAPLERYLCSLDERLPHRLTGLYLIGSVALGDYRPGASDIDVVAVTATRLDSGELDAVEAIHREIVLPLFSVTYVTYDDLRSDPRTLDGIAFHHEGTFGRSGGFDANSAVWETLRRYPLAVRGTALPDVWHDPAGLRDWTLQNLDSYWRPLAAQVRARVEAGGPLPGEALLTWCVPGVPRMHYSVATGDITSKSGACRYMLEHFPQRWHPLASAALAALHDPATATDDSALLSEVPDLMDFAIDDAHSLAGDRSSTVGLGGLPAV
jgi:hypothetical protein